jgi:excisionase family DNA binding protein
MADRLLTAVEVAELFQVSVSWVRREARAGRLPSIRLGRSVRFRQATVVAWIESRERSGARR